MRSVIHSLSRVLAITINVRVMRRRLVERQLAHVALRSVASGSVGCIRVRRTILFSLVI